MNSEEMHSDEATSGSECTLTLGELRALFYYHLTELNNPMLMNGRRVYCSRKVKIIGRLLEERIVRKQR